ncbi:MAG: cobalamin biosynthesis protein [Lachnospiraceae bacterium]|nr:cobalamin biosynthesis protein [Lachnospiraceae bacterium]
MRKLAVCFTENGARIIEKINRACDQAGINPATGYICRAEGDVPEGLIRIDTTIGEWADSVFLPGNALIFVGAVGIAVRAVSPLVKDKFIDCPVIVIDDNGQFVIPVLSGHAGGGNKLAVTLASLIDALPVITTSTDVNDAFSVDTFATENRLSVRNREGIKRVSVKAIEEKKITLSIKDYPPKEKVDVVVADETDAEYTLLLSPKKYTVGLGMKRGKDADQADVYFREILEKTGLQVSDIYAICTIDVKEDEPAISALRDHYRLPVLSFDAALLSKAEGTFEASEFVRQTVGVDNVCERAAVLGAGAGAQLILKKQSRDGMTIAIAKRTNNVALG